MLGHQLLDQRSAATSTLRKASVCKAEGRGVATYHEFTHSGKGDAMVKVFR